MRILKIAVYVAAGLAALIVVAMLLIVLLVDPNHYRNDIERLAERQLGRPLSLDGELKLSVFPWLALQTGHASIGEAPGFGEEPFVSIREARVSAKLLPLLRGRFEVGAVRLAGARIRLLTDAQGRNNWDDLVARQASGQSVAAASDGAAPPPIIIAGLEIRDAALLIENRREGTRRAVRDFNLKTGRLQSGEPFDFTAGFVLEQEASFSIKVHVVTHITADLERNVYRLAEPEIDVTLSGPEYPREGLPFQVRAGVLEADIGRKRYQLDGLSVATRWKGDGFPSAGVPIALQAKVSDLDLAAQTLELTDVDLNVAGAQLGGRLHGAGILDAPRISGPLTLAPISPREWLPRLGIELPLTRDPEVFKHLSFSSQVTLDKSSAQFTDMVMQLDDTTAKGMLGVADFDTMALRFDLDVDRLDADRYLAPPQEGAGGPRDETPMPLPLEALRKLDARGQLRVQEAVFAGIRFTQLRLGVNARDGKVRFHPAEASMYGGRYNGDIGIDAAGKEAQVTLDEHVSGVDFAPLFKDFFDSERVSGKGSANIKASGRGRTSDDIVRTLNGSLDFSVTDGALEGADLWYEIRRARALLKQETVPARSGPARTPFTAATGSGVIRGGVLSNDDLRVAMQYLQVSGQGTMDIPAETLDYRLLATVMKIPRESALGEEMQEVIDAEIPVTVTGPFADLKVRPDVEGYLKGRVKERVEQEKQKVEEKIREKLGDKLQDLFKR
ncbi:hypothetical protein ACG33_12870 [Steroidobacter denitrificans]|uniref:AsmA domain-containing protein n=1 Tax=Steroidobacter denitrificans TaxID=465721 RepID=A0A127FC56_STEDE|nr:AsmA family protein [Steroidobacter denitrificans]AMN47973.1 hypothetical protein ACG33_12870 [Steroidobacter denitrificans]